MSRYVQLRWASPDAMSAGEQPVCHMPMILGLIGIGHDMPSDVALSEECPCRVCDPSSDDVNSG